MKCLVLCVEAAEINPVFKLPDSIPCKNTVTLFCISFLPTSVAVASWSQETVIQAVCAFTGSFTPKLHIPGFCLGTSQISDCTTEEAAFPHRHTHRPVRSHTLNKRRILPHFFHHISCISCIHRSVAACFALLGPICYSGWWPVKQRPDNLGWLRAEEMP